MTKARSASFHTHKLGAVTTLNMIAKIVCSDGYTVGLANTSRDVIYDDGDGEITYKASLSAAHSNIETNVAVSVDNGEIYGALSETADEGFTVADIRAGRFDGADIYLYEVNYKDLTMGHEMVGPGRYKIGRFVIDEDLGEFTAEILSLITLLNQNIAERTSLTCRAQFGDHRCKVIIKWQTGIQGNVTEVATDPTLMFTDDTLVGIGLVDDHLAGVNIVWTGDSPLAGEISQISSFDSATGEIVLVSATSADITTSDTWEPENLNPDLIQTVEVDSVGADPRWIFTVTDSNTSQPDNFYVPGVIEWLTGDNAGSFSEVKAHISDEYELTFPTAYDIQAGDTLTIRRDCTKIWGEADSVGTSTCGGYNNQKNFQGEPFMPVETAGEYANV